MVCHFGLPSYWKSQIVISKSGENYGTRRTDPGPEKNKCNEKVFEGEQDKGLVPFCPGNKLRIADQ